MENINLTETKIIDLIIKYNNNNTHKVLFFIEYDCNIKFKIEVSNRINPLNGIMYFYYKLKYNGQLSDIEFFNVVNDITCIYQTDPEKVLMSLFKLLSDKEIENIKNILINNNCTTSKYSHIKEKILNLNIAKDINNSIIVRVDEFIKCLDNEIPLSAIFLAGSILESVLLNCAMQNDALFKKTMSIKKNQNKDFSKWVLDDFIDISKEVGLIKQDMKMFCDVIREFRNYIHPHKEIKNGFTPDMHTAKMCFNTLEITFEQIAENIDKI